MITNYQTQKIIKNWYEKSQLEEDVFNKFIALWISFNAFFIATFKDEFQDHRFPAEYEFLKKVQLSSLLQGTYKSIDKASILNLIDFLEHGETSQGDHMTTHFNKKVADMRYEGDEDKATEFSDVDDFSQFINCIYQVRCNLFHGNKSDGNPADAILVERSYDSLYAFLTEVYKKN